MKKNNKGFTLAELLIVVAIIAVLVAISIPIFTSQLEKAREATDASNIRAAYAEVVSAALLDDQTNYSATVTLQQKENNWQNTTLSDTIAKGYISVGTGISAINGVSYDGQPKAGGTCTVSYTAPAEGAGQGSVKIAFSA